MTEIIELKHEIIRLNAELTALRADKARVWGENEQLKKTINDMAQRDSHEGYVLVPIQPTIHMLYAGENTDLPEFCTSSRQSRHHDLFGQIYKAMIKAAKG